jgi:hypothetical protein
MNMTQKEIVLTVNIHTIEKEPGWWNTHLENTSYEISLPGKTSCLFIGMNGWEAIASYLIAHTLDV